MTTLLEGGMPSESKTRRLAGLRGVVREGDNGRLWFRSVLLPGTMAGVRNCSNERSCSGMRRGVSMMVGWDVSRNPR